MLEIISYSGHLTIEQSFFKNIVWTTIPQVFCNQKHSYENEKFNCLIISILQL